ncbi:MAG TPA: hypothetical protein VHP32_11315 [Ignavibacteria bacterium]|nr:hypothetical protein [Ignavibacteria bacterium]
MKRSISIFLFLLFLVSSCDQQKKPVQEKISFNDFFNKIKNSLSDSLLKKDFSIGYFRDPVTFIYSVDSNIIFFDIKKELITKKDIKINRAQLNLDTNKIIAEINSYIKLMRQLKIIAMGNEKTYGRFTITFNVLNLDSLPKSEYKITHKEGQMIYLYEQYKSENINLSGFIGIGNNWFLRYGKY